MRQKTLSSWLKLIIAGVSLCALIVFLLVIPILGKIVILIENGEFEYCYWPWLVFIWIAGIPCFIALFFAWKIATNIGNDRSFTNENAKLLKSISVLAAVDSAFFFVGNIVYLFLNMNHPGIVLASFLVVFIGIAISVAAAILSHLVIKAAVLQEQSDLTI